MSKLERDARRSSSAFSISASIERWDGIAWQPVAPAKWETCDRDLHLAVPRVAVGLANANTALRFDFKWADNLPEALDVLDQGDTAPNARFNYRYIANTGST